VQQASFNSQKGAALAEYALAASLILVVCLVAGALLVGAFREREFASYEAISGPVPCLPGAGSDDCK